MKIQPINKTEFEQILPIQQIITHEYPRKFARLELEELQNHYGLSWQSPSVELCYEYSLDRQFLWIGVDRQVAAINLQNGRISVMLPLTANLIQIQAVGDAIAVLTEVEILLFNSTGSLRFSRGFPDLPEQILVEGENPIVPLMNGDRFCLNPNTGKLRQLTPELVQ